MKQIITKEYKTLKKPVLVAFRFIEKALLIAVFLFSLPILSFSQNISMDLGKVTLYKVFKNIKEQADIDFFYSENNLDTKRLVLANFKNTDVLIIVSKLVGDAYKVEKTKDGIVLITLRKVPSFQKKITVSGKITNKDGEPLIGVTILIKGTKKGVSSDFDGKYSIRVPKNATLVFSSVGYIAKEVEVKGKTKINVSLEEKANKIKDVVITGIVTRKKESFTGAAVTVTGDELKAIGNTNIINTLKTIDPSFIVYENNNFGSDPNQLPNIEIRGRTSISQVSVRDSFGKDPNQPLFILNGFPTSLQTVVDLDMNLVSSITILKDAASTALYGSQAANGVVVIETVKPKPGKLRINYNYDFQMQMPDLSDYNLMNAAEKLEFEKLAGRWGNSSAGRWENYRFINKPILDKKYNSILADVKRGVNTYWLSEPLGAGFSARHSLYVSGGSDSFTYGVGVNYRNTDGVMKGSGKNTWGTNIDLTYRKGKINVLNNLIINGFDSNESPYGSFSNFAKANPYYRKRDKNGQIRRYLDKKLLMQNPLYDASLPYINRGDELKIENRLNLIFDITDKLKFTSGLFLSTTTNEKETFLSREHSQFLKSKSDEKGSYTNERTDGSDYNFNAMLTYSNFSGKHVITGSLRGEIEEKKNKLYQTKVVGFPSGSNGNPKFARGYLQDSKPTTNLNIYRKVKVLATVNYSYDNTYLFDATYTIDGSTNFGSEKKFSPFWSVGLGWNLHHQFNMDSEKVQMLKLRGNIGSLGNQNLGGTSSSGVYNSYSFINHFGQGARLTSLGNPYLEWQKTIQTSIGIDAILFDRRLNLTINAYRKKTDPLIVSTKTTSSTGIPNYAVNLGFLDNKGLEFNMRYFLIHKRQEQIYWSLGITGRTERSRYGGFGSNLDYVNKEGRELKIPSLVRYIDGNSPDDLWAVPSLGIDPATGDEVFLTKDGRESVSFDHRNERVMGNSRPTMEGVFSTSLRYKNFTVGANIRYRFGGDLFNIGLYNNVENIGIKNIIYNQDRRALYGRWKKQGDISRFKNIDFVSRYYGSSSKTSSRFIQRENVIIGESLNFSYELKDQRLMDKLGLTRLRFDLYTKDIFRLSSIRVERGIDYPFARSVSFSIKASF